MAIHTVCPRCDREYTLADEKEGKTVKCKGCSETFVVEPLPQKAPPTGKPASRKDDDVKDEIDATEDEKEKRAVPKPRKKSGKKRNQRAPSSRLGLLLLLAGGSFCVVLLGCGALAFFVYFKGGPLGIGLAANVNEDAFDQLRTGMTEAEVIAILGPETHRKVGPDLPEKAPVAGKDIHVVDLVHPTWEFGNNKIEIVFDMYGKAMRATAKFEAGQGRVKELVGNKYDQLCGGDQTIWYRLPNGQLQPPPKLPSLPPGPSKIIIQKVNGVEPGRTADEVLQRIGEQPTKKLGPQLMPNGKQSADTWLWVNGNGFLKVHFDADMKVIDKKWKDLPFN